MRELAKVEQLLSRKGIHEDKLRFIGKHYRDLRKEFGGRVTLEEGRGREQACYRPSARTTVCFFADRFGTSVKDSPIAGIKIWWE